MEGTLIRARALGVLSYAMAVDQALSAAVYVSTGTQRHDVLTQVVRLAYMAGFAIFIGALWRVGRALRGPRANARHYVKQAVFIALGWVMAYVVITRRGRGLVDFAMALVRFAVLVAIDVWLSKLPPLEDHGAGETIVPNASAALPASILVFGYVAVWALAIVLLPR